MTCNITSLVAAFIAFCIGLGVKIIFDWFKLGKSTNLHKMKEEISWIKEIHDKRDAEGLPLWYIPREWKKTLDIVSERTMETNIILKDIRDILSKK